MSRAFENVFDEPLATSIVNPVGSWVGGIETEIRSSRPRSPSSQRAEPPSAALGWYAAAIYRLGEALSVSDGLRPAPAELRKSIDQDSEDLPEAGNRHAPRGRDEPIRLKLRMMSARLRATAEAFADREQGRASSLHNGYANKQAFLDDLRLVRRALRAAGAKRADEGLVHPSRLWSTGSASVATAWIFARTRTPIPRPSTRSRKRCPSPPSTAPIFDGSSPVVVPSCRPRFPSTIRPRRSWRSSGPKD